MHTRGRTHQDPPSRTPGTWGRPIEFVIECAVVLGVFLILATVSSELGPLVLRGLVEPWAAAARNLGGVYTDFERHFAHEFVPWADV